MTRMFLRRGTAASWTSANPTLAAGEEGYETDTGKRKVGDGSTAWNSLAYGYAESGLGAHLADATDAHDASAISVADAGGYFTSTDVEAALQELGAGGGGVPTSRTITAGAGLTGGGDLSANRTLDVQVDASTIEINSDTLRVKASGITANEIAADAVGSSELASTAVTPGTYGDATHVAQVTFDADGRATAASDVAITGSGGSSQHILLADGRATPFAFADLLQMDDGSDFMWSDPE